MPRTGRPRIEIKQDLFEGLCRIQCTGEEIASVLHVSMDTLSRWVKRTYAGRTFEDTYKKYADVGKMSLRRAQMKLAEGGNATMLIWLGKQLLGQKDKSEIEYRELDANIERELAQLTASREVPPAGEITASELIQ